MADVTLELTRLIVTFQVVAEHGGIGTDLAAVIADVGHGGADVEVDRVDVRLESSLGRVFLVVVVADLTFEAFGLLVAIEVVEEVVAAGELLVAAPTAKIAWELLKFIKFWAVVKPLEIYILTDFLNSNFKKKLCLDFNFFLNL